MKAKYNIIQSSHIFLIAHIEQLQLEAQALEKPIYY